MLLEKSIKNKSEQPYLDWIKSGKKRYEGRLQTKILEWGLFIGKTIKFYDEDDHHSYVMCKIIDLQTFDNFGLAFDMLGSELIPERTRNEVVNMYNDIFHYDDEILNQNITSKMISDNGVVAIGLEIIE
jgi:ASC-1-like (ASCH) protein